MIKTFNRFIEEEWVKDTKVQQSWQPETSLSIFKNPGSSDLSKLAKSGLEAGMIRFIAIAAGQSFYCWNAALATHYDIILDLAKNNLIPSGLENKNDECVKGIAQLSGGHLKFSRSGEREYHADRNIVLDDDVVESILANEPVAKRFLPPPWTTTQSIRDAAPSMMKKFGFIDRYVSGYMENSLWSMILNAKPEE